MDAPLIVDQGKQPLHGLTQLRHIPPRQQLLENRVLGCGEQVLQRLGVRGVPRFDLLRLRQPTIDEQDFLQLFGGSQIEGAANDVVGRVLRRPHGGAELLGQAL